MAIFVIKKISSPHTHKCFLILAPRNPKEDTNVFSPRHLMGILNLHKEVLFQNQKILAPSNDIDLYSSLSRCQDHGLKFSDLEMWLLLVPGFLDLHTKQTRGIFNFWKIYVSYMINSGKLCWKVTKSNLKPYKKPIKTKFSSFFSWSSRSFHFISLRTN